MLGDRIKTALRLRDMKQIDLARKVGVKQQTISYLIKTNASQSQYVVKIADVLGVNPRWLQDGVGEPHDTTVRIEVAGVEIKLKTLPVLDCKDVPTWLEIGETDNPRPDFVTDQEAGKASFALVVCDDSMEPALSPGDRVAFDPQITPMPGDIVCAESDKNVSIRRFRALPRGQFELAPNNADWSSAYSQDGHNVRVVATMFEVRRYR